jgi:hypothetical protein
VDLSQAVCDFFRSPSDSGVEGTEEVTTTPTALGWRDE